MLRIVPIFLAVVLIVWLGVVQGIWADRWAEPGIDAKEFAARLALVPMKIGVWEGEDREQDAAVLKGAGAVGSVSRIYRNTKTGEQVSVFIICGHSRDVAGHTPQECYPAAGMPQKGGVKPWILDRMGDAKIKDNFSTAVFSKESTTEGVESVRVFWAWLSEADQSWQAPENAKLHYAGVRALFKVYLINGNSGESPADTSSVKFARVFMPTLTEALRPSPTAPVASPDEKQQAQPQSVTADHHV